MPIKFNSHLATISRQRSGSWRSGDDGIFLDRNERAMPIDPLIQRELGERLSTIDFHKYPELGPFYSKLSEWLNVSIENLLLTEGADGGIKQILHALVGSGQSVIFPIPTFALYSVYCELLQVESKTVGYENYRLCTNQIFDLVDSQTAVVFLPNPNNPIESELDQNIISKLATHCGNHNCALVLDEVYFPYSNISAIDLISQFDNLFVLRSFSKAFGLAGIRLGYLVGPTLGIKVVGSTRTGYETNSLSIEVASFFIDHYSIVEDYVSDVRDGLTLLKKVLTDNQIICSGGNAGNFLFVELPSVEMACAITARLKEQKIFIRSGWPPPFEKGISITGAPSEVMAGVAESFVQQYSKLSN